MVILNMRLEGLPEEIINEMVNKGIASNKTEAIRLLALDYNEHHNIKPMNQFIEDQLAIKRMQEMDNELKTGKAKIIKKEDILKKYPHLRDV